MRLSYSSFNLFVAITSTTNNIGFVSSFGGIASPNNNAFRIAVQSTHQKHTATVRQMSDDNKGDDWKNDEKDNDDDWFSDFDPSAYQSSPKPSSSQSTRSPSSSSRTTFNEGEGWDSPDRTSGGWESDRYDRGRGGGGGGRDNNRGMERFGTKGHDYTRDNGRDSSSVDEAAVDALLAKRLEARLNRQYDTADEIRDQLLNQYSVGVTDRDKTWHTGGGRSGGYGRQDGNQRDNRAPPRRTRDFGPTGHDYYQSEGAGPIESSLTEDGINELLAERLQAKMRRDFNTADGIQEELFDNGVSGPIESSLTEDGINELLAERLQAKMRRDFNTADGIQEELFDNGVFVHDAMKEWRADGVSFGESNDRGRNPGKERNSRASREAYKMSSYSEAPGEGMPAESLLQKLIEERVKCKMRRDYDKADAIRDGLINKYNVVIHDKAREWSIGGDFGPEFNEERRSNEVMSARGYLESQSSSPVLTEEETTLVQDLVSQRWQAKKDRDFDGADQIRDDLYSRYDVAINDILKLWSVGGAFGAEGGPTGKQVGTYTRRGGLGELTEDDVETINKRMHERYQAKKARDFNTADSIRDNLRATFKVSIDDFAREWHIDSDEYVMVESSPGAPVLSDEDCELIAEKLKERHTYKVERNYEAADAIRDGLKMNYNVMVDDKNKEWKCLAVDVDTDATDGVVSADASFVLDSETSQMSPFKKKQEAEDFDDAFDDIFASDDDDETMGESLTDDDDEYVSTIGGDDDEYDTTIDDDDDDDDDSIDDDDNDTVNEMMDNSFDTVDEAEEVSPVASEEEAFTSFTLESDLVDETEVETTSNVSEEELSKMTVVQLKEKLREAGKPVSGKKAELIERLL
eukprot:CAMPEP_0194446346 /NCGR_PEP_ID=MMETSP0176-20130528/128384_1 /TAXON_ID=216777 /ORGANISM="Proboscia alata, Strain PI-D3" /LENGTH=861 /DNA_ID=CAMNT_0039273043 /DNA_START=156 /DNA_END=2741 /DNA_ORIENTATION=+